MADFTESYSRYIAWVEKAADASFPREPSSSDFHLIGLAEWAARVIALLRSEPVLTGIVSEWARLNETIPGEGQRVFQQEIEVFVRAASDAPPTAWFGQNPLRRGVRDYFIRSGQTIADSLKEIFESAPEWVRIAFTLLKELLEFIEHAIASRDA